MKLPVRIRYKGEDIEDVELREMSGADIAEVKRVSANGDMYSAFLAFAVSCTKSLGGVEDRQTIKEIYKGALFDTVYAVAIAGMALTRGINTIEGRYKCKCGAIVEHMGEFADPLPQYEPQDGDDVPFDCDEITITNSKSGEVMFSCEKLLMRRPTVQDLIKAYRVYPDDDAFMQFETYKNCILQVNGKDISEKERNLYGDLIFKKMSVSNLRALGQALNIPVGKTECVCLKCKNRWTADLDLTNFFDLEAD